ncbi:MAG: hypothetical protein EZS28_055119, partial [Streblomastix strix]
VTDPNNQFIKGTQQFRYIPIEEAVNRLPLLSEDPKRQVEIKICTGERVQYINKMEQNEIFQNMMSSMMNKLQNHSDEDEAMRQRRKKLNQFAPKEQQRVKSGFGLQMRLASFNESQIQNKIAEQNINIVYFDTELFFLPYQCLEEFVMFAPLRSQERFPMYEFPPLFYSEFPQVGSVRGLAPGCQRCQSSHQFQFATIEVFVLVALPQTG